MAVINPRRVPEPEEAARSAVLASLLRLWSTALSKMPCGEAGHEYEALEDLSNLKKLDVFDYQPEVPSQTLPRSKMCVSGSAKSPEVSRRNLIQIRNPRQCKFCGGKVGRIQRVLFLVHLDRRRRDPAGAVQE